MRIGFAASLKDSYSPDHLKKKQILKKILWTGLFASQFFVNAFGQSCSGGSQSINTLGASEISWVNSNNYCYTISQNNGVSTTGGNHGIVIYSSVTNLALINYGVIQSYSSSSLWAQGGNSQISQLVNAATGSILAPGSGGAAIYSVAGIGLLNNAGLIQGSSAGIRLSANGSIGTLNNTGTITGADNIVLPGGPTHINILNNSQGLGNSAGALVINGNLPRAYNIIIDGSEKYGQLKTSSLASSANFAFNIYGNTGTTLVSGTSASSITPAYRYQNVLQGFSSLTGITGATGAYNGFNYRLIANATTANNWDLLVSSSIRGAGTVYSSANLGTLVDPKFDGGTLQISSAGTISTGFTVTSNHGVIDQNAVTSNISGNITNDTLGAAGAIKIQNSGAAGSGSVTLSGANTYTGGTTVTAGANLKLASASAVGTGAVNLVGTATIPATLSLLSSMTINNSITVSGDPVIDVASGQIVAGMGPITDGQTAGDIVKTGAGTLTLLSAANTYTGGTYVQQGILQAGVVNTLPVGGFVNISSGATLDLNGYNQSISSLSGAGDTTLGGATLTLSNASDTYSGNISGSGGLNLSGGTQTLSGANTYSGNTVINSGSTLALSGSGSIAQSAAVTNNGTLNVASKSGNVVLGGTYTQGSTGSLALSFSPANNQQLNVAGAVSLGGGLTLTASAGAYKSGRYTLLTGSSITGTFSSFSTNLGSYTAANYNLLYDASSVYLYLVSLGPSTADTQQSLFNTAGILQNTFTLQNAVLANSFSYDCDTFGDNNVCISAGGRNTAVSAANGLNNTSGLLIAAYRPHSNYRIGAYVDQNLSVNNPGAGVILGNNTPLLGLFGAWNERLDGTGTEVKISAAYGQKNTTITRQVVGSSEAGSGGSQLNSQGAQATAKYGFGVATNTILSPYIGIRYTQNNMGGYTETASSSVTAPLSYSALNTNATTVLAGVGASYRGIPQTTLFASAGVESDTNTQNGSINATGVAGLTPVNFNPNPVKTRPTAMVGASYDVEKNQRLGITGIYRQEAYQATASTTVMATYTIGF